MRYLFHNVYGDAAALIASAPADVTCVPFGWDDATEAARNKLLRELDTVVSGLPSLIYFDGWLQEWREVRVDLLQGAWHWARIDAEITAQQAQTTPLYQAGTLKRRANA